MFTSGPRPRVLVLTVLCILVVGIVSDLPAVDDKPEPPLALKAPEAPSSEYSGQDLREYSARALANAANTAIQQEAFDDAVMFQHWAVVADPSSGQYNLSCYYARAGNADASLYWLQKAALEEGVDHDWCSRDPDFESLRKDERWAQALGFVKSANAYWRTSKLVREVVTVPAGYKVGTPIPVVLGFHGMGSKPEDFAGSDFEQGLADKLGVAFISVSATLPRGPNSFVWSEDIARDRKHVMDAVQRVADRVTPKPGAVIGIGFSQGAQLSVELAARDPELFCGAIVLCPGFGGDDHLAEVKASPRLGKRAFVVVSGAEEHPGNLELAAKDAAWLRQAGAVTVHHTFEGMGHTFPPGYRDHFMMWTRFLLEIAERK